MLPSFPAAGGFALRCATAFVIAVALLSSTATSARAQTVMLAGTDFTLALARIDPVSGAFVTLDASSLGSYFTAARCACPTNVVVALSVNSDAAAQLTSADTLEATLMVGANCDNVAATACPTLGAVLNLDSSTTASEQTVTTGAIFSSIQGTASCDALPATSTRLFAIIRQNGVLLASQPSLPIGFGAATAVPPTAVKLETANNGLLVSWTEAADTSGIQGYQVLCSPGPATPIDPVYETCAALPPTTGSGPFATLDPQFLCSGLVTAGNSSVRLTGLQNETTYQIAVISIGNDGSPSAASVAVPGTPGPTLGFDDIYRENGGTAPTGCAVAGRSGDHRPATGLAVTLALLGLLFLRSRRRRVPQTRRARGGSAIAMPLALAATLAGSLASIRTARADWADLGEGFDHSVIIGDPTAPAPAHTERHWNLELRFGPYKPDIDSEFADRGQAARPFEETFGSSKHLMSQLEIDRQFAYRGGTWAIGVSGGYYHTAARALAADHVTRTGDDTALRLIPLSVSLVYRADIWHQQSGFPFTPYAKAGLDDTLWSVTDTAKTSTAMKGSTLGWHGAAGVSLDLAFLDPESAHILDTESGVNQFALFFEVAHYAISGLGASSALRVGDTTWLAGLMLEM